MYEFILANYLLLDWKILFQINNDRDLLPNITLELRWNDTRGDTVVATRAMTDMICEGVSAFFGPEGACYVEAIVSQARNIPMISYVSVSLRHCTLLPDLQLHIFVLEMFRLQSIQRAHIRPNRTARYPGNFFSLPNTHT